MLGAPPAAEPVGLEDGCRRVDRLPACAGQDPSFDAVGDDELTSQLSELQSHGCPLRVVANNAPDWRAGNELGCIAEGIGRRFRLAFPAGNVIAANRQPDLVGSPVPGRPRCRFQSMQVEFRQRVPP